MSGSVTLVMLAGGPAEGNRPFKIKLALALPAGSVAHLDPVHASETLQRTSTGAARVALPDDLERLGVPAGRLS